MPTVQSLGIPSALHLANPPLHLLPSLPHAPLELLLIPKPNGNDCAHDKIQRNAPKQGLKEASASSSICLTGGVLSLVRDGKGESVIRCWTEGSERATRRWEEVLMLVLVRVRAELLSGERGGDERRSLGV